MHKNVKMLIFSRASSIMSDKCLLHQKKKNDRTLSLHGIIKNAAVSTTTGLLRPVY